MIRYRLLSKRPKALEWGIRNALELFEPEDHNLRYMERQKRGWEIIEPETQFLIEKSLDGRHWVRA